MSKIPEFNLPSKPDVVVRLREATVGEAMDFADVLPGFEEALTTRFLSTVQEKDAFSDPKTWTGDDRRLALYWYWLHTAEDTAPAMRYPCTLCKKEHTVAFDLRVLADEYKTILGNPWREVEGKDAKIVVRPLIGRDLEELEVVRMELAEAVAADGAKSAIAGKISARLKMLSFMLRVSFPIEGEATTEEDRRAARENAIIATPYTEFASLVEKVENATAEMEHGLPSVFEDGRIMLYTPAIKCPDNPEEEGTRLKIPFRNFDYIPRI